MDDQTTQQIAKLTLGKTHNRSFLESAQEKATQQFGDDWKDPTKKVAYRWENPRLSDKFGDKAENATLDCLSQPEFCELLGEPVYLISGKGSF